MDDLISRETAIDVLNEYFVRIGKLKRRGLNKGEKAIRLDAVGVINSLPSAQPEQKSDIEEAVEYIKNAQEYLRDIGETWCANYLSDAIELLVRERRGEEDERGQVN